MDKSGYEIMSDGWKWKWFDENGIWKRLKHIVAKHALGTRDQEAIISRVGEIGYHGWKWIRVDMKSSLMDENGNDLMKMELEKSKKYCSKTCSGHSRPGSYYVKGWWNWITWMKMDKSGYDIMSDGCKGKWFDENGIGKR